MKTSALVAATRINSNLYPSYVRAFTLIELLSVLAVAAILAGLLLPAAFKTKALGQRTKCLSNLKQFTLAWMMYHQEHDDRLVPNVPWSDTNSWVRGWINWVDPDLPANTNEVYLRDSKLSPYLGASTEIWKCPADRDQAVNGGKIVRRVRSISMNGWLNPEKDWNLVYCPPIYCAPVYSAPAPGFKSVRRITDIARPANIFVFHDERYESLNDGCFEVAMQYRGRDGLFADFPGSYHNRHGNFSFADGHVTSKRWLDRRTYGSKATSRDSLRSVSSPNNPDLAWLQAHTTEHK
jgi:prepilin-type N-terminal cleavage/methylation domain-containing protein/prepilin-type processing-associated H-X9-DG protein